MHKVGDKASFSKTFSQVEIEAFAKISGDTNPLHLDPDFASAAMFGRPIAHGFLVGSLISAILGKQLPGPGTIYLSQQLNFKKPVFPNEEITATVEVIEMKPAKVGTIYTLSTKCWNQIGEIVLEGLAVVMQPLESN